MPGDIRQKNLAMKYLEILMQILSLKVKVKTVLGTFAGIIQMEIILKSAVLFTEMILVIKFVQPEAGDV